MSVMRFIAMSSALTATNCAPRARSLLEPRDQQRRVDDLPEVGERECTLYRPLVNDERRGDSYTEIVCEVRRPRGPRVGALRRVALPEASRIQSSHARDGAQQWVRIAAPLPLGLRLVDQLH